MRFVDFLKTTVLLSAGAATALASVTVLAAEQGSSTLLAPIAVGWWVLAALVGLRMGRRAETNPPIARLLAGARATTTLPEQHPGAILLNRLWSLLLFTLLAGVGEAEPRGVVMGDCGIEPQARERASCNGQRTGSDTGCRPKFKPTGIH